MIRMVHDIENPRTDCPNCLIASGMLQNIATGLARGAGGYLGTRLAGPVGGRIGDDVMPLAVEFAAHKVVEKRKRRRKSAYQKELGRQMKAWKKAHPRAKPGSIMSHAHRKTKAIIKKRQKKRGKGRLPKGRL